MQIDLDSHPGVVIARPHGALTVDIALSWAPELERTPGVHPGLDIIFDLTAADVTALSRADIQRVVQILGQRGPDGPKRVAYVADNELAFGILRMFETMASFQAPRQRGVFRSVADALDWLAR